MASTTSTSPGATGNGQGTFWRVVQVVIVALLLWVGAQLVVIPQHGFQLDTHERRLDSHEKLIERQGEASSALLRAVERMNAHLEAEESERKRSNARRAR